MSTNLKVMHMWLPTTPVKGFSLKIMRHNGIDIHVHSLYRTVLMQET